MGDPGARVLTFGTNTPLNLDRPHMVKTGTTDDYRDTWTIGCVPQICVGVWMGNTNNDPMVKVSSSLTAGRIWVEMMQALIERKRWAPDPWPKPGGRGGEAVDGAAARRRRRLRGECSSRATSSAGSWRWTGCGRTDAECPSPREGPYPPAPSPCAGEGEIGADPPPCAGEGAGGWGLLLVPLALLTAGCQQVERLAEVAPRVDHARGLAGAPRHGAPVAPAAPRVTLPPEQRPTRSTGSRSGPTRPAMAAVQGDASAVGGSPSLVALEKLTPLFNVDGKGPVEYTTEAFFAAEPASDPALDPAGRRVRADGACRHVRGALAGGATRTAMFGQTRLRDYVSDRGDRLRLYLTDRFPILYELGPWTRPGQALLRFHPDLAYLLGSGRLDPLGLARLMYRVEHPDLVQMQITRKLAAEVQARPGRRSDGGPDAHLPGSGPAGDGAGDHRRAGR